MSVSPRRPARDPLISRQYEPSRIQFDSLVSAYASVLPGVSCRLGASDRRLGEPDRANAPGGRLRSSVVGA